MSQLVRISRGKIASKILASQRLASGELFFDKEKKVVYLGDGAETGVDGKYFALGGLNTLRYAGAITALPATPNYGDLYEVTTKFTVANDGTGASYDANVGDFLVYVYKDTDLEGYNLGTTSKKWLRINNSGGSAVETSFDPTGTNLLASSIDVQKAIVDLDRHKIAYGGLFVSSAACIPGYMYYVDTNTTQFIDTDSGEINNDPNAVAGVSNGKVYLSKGNLLVCSSDTVENGTGVTPIKKFQVIDLGSNASDITITTALTRLAASDAKVDYGTTDAALTNLQDILQTIFSTKADLDKKGKIYLDQLPSTIIGAMEYQGLWANATALPTSSDKAANNSDIDDQNAGENSLLVKGDYWIYSGATFYVTKAGAITTEGAAGAIRVNNGDWLIVESNVAGAVSWNVLSNDSSFKGIIADGTLHEGTPEITDDDRVIEVTSPTGGNTIKIAAPKAMANTDTASEVGRIYKAADDKNNFTKSAIIEGAANVAIEDKGLALKKTVNTTTPAVPGNVETFEVTEVTPTLDPKVTVDGTDYDFGAAITGFNLAMNGDGTVTYTAQAAGAHTVTGNADVTVTVGTVGDASTPEVFTVAEKAIVYTVVVDGVTYNDGDAIPGFTRDQGAGHHAPNVYTAAASGVHTVAAGQNVTINETVKGTADVPGGTTQTPVSAIISQNAAQTADITVTLPSKSGTLVVEEDLKKVSAKVHENFLPVKVGDEFVDSPVSRTLAADLSVTGVNVTGQVTMTAGSVVGTVTAGTASTKNALPATNGTLLNENSDIDGGYFA